MTRDEAIIELSKATDINVAELIRTNEEFAHESQCVFTVQLVSEHWFIGLQITPDEYGTFFEAIATQDVGLWEYWKASYTNDFPEDDYDEDPIGAGTPDDALLEPGMVN